MKYSLTHLFVTLVLTVFYAYSSWAQTCYTEVSRNVIYDGRNAHNGSWAYAVNAYTAIGEWVELTDTVRNGDSIRVTVEIQNWSRTIADSTAVTNAGLQWDSLGYYHPFTLSLYELPDSFLNLSQSQLEAGAADEVVLTSFQQLRDTQLVRWSPTDSINCPSTYFLDAIDEDNWRSSDPNQGCIRYSNVTFEFPVDGLSAPTDNLVFGFSFPVSQNSSLPSGGPWDNLNVSTNVQTQPVHIGSNPRVSDWWVQGFTPNGANIPVQEDYILTGGPTTIRHFTTYNNLDYVGLPVKVELINTDAIDCIEKASINNLDVRFGQTPYSFNWTGPNGFSSTSQNLNNLIYPGTYTVTITDADSPSCVLSKNFEVIDIEPNLATKYPESVSPTGQWYAYHYNGENYDTYTGFDSIATLNFTQEFPDLNNDGVYDADVSCGVDISQRHSTRYFRTLNDSAGQYTVRFTADFHARISFDGGTTFSGYTNNYSQTVPLNGNEDIVIEYRNRPPGTGQISVTVRRKDVVGLIKPEIELSLYPNPANSYFTVTLPEASDEAVELNLVDLQGRTVLSKVFPADQQQLRLELPSGLGSALYLVQLNGDFRETWRVMVNR